MERRIFLATLALFVPAFVVPVAFYLNGLLDGDHALLLLVLLFAVGALAKILWQPIEAKAFSASRPSKELKPSEKLAEAEARIELLETLWRNFPDAVLLVNEKRELIALNPSARELFGTQGVVGADLARTLRAPLVLDAANNLLQHAADEPRSLDVECQLGGATPHELVARMVALPRKFRSRIALFIAIHDLSSGSRVERMRAEFVSNVSHELRSPLASLIGFIETLKGPAKDDAKARDRFLGIMEKEADRMSRLINDLLSLSQVEAAEFVRPKEQVELFDIIGRLLEVLDLRAAEKGVALVFESGDLARVVVQGDDDQLTQVFQNLLDNALKYGPEGRPISVRLDVPDLARKANEPARLEVRVSVRNEGPGIPAEHLRRLTERFYRVDKGRSRAMGGTGLGLAIVKHVLNRHKGRLSVSSKPGQGATFTVHLPVLEVDYKPSQATDQAAH
ncbi:MAG: sensor histidine kinase [Magnetovibrionaceae bacterium]